MDRDCDNCAYAKPTHTMDNGCTAWTCEFIPRVEAIKAWKEKHEKERAENDGKRDNL